MILLQGGNGQGKSNLLEAIYLLAIAKSPRTSTDRELIRQHSIHKELFTSVTAIAKRDGERLRLQINIKGVPVGEERNRDSRNASPQRNSLEGISVQKYIRVNGTPRRASGLIGQLNAVMFSAEDMELVYGPPSLRRRYMDILLSQIDPHYLRSLQRYQRVVYQRNHLLKRIREGSSKIEELTFWDDQLVSEGKYIMNRRLRTIRELSELSAPIHQELTSNGERIALEYQPSVDVNEASTEDALAQQLWQAINARRQREIAQGATVSGPHRDDLQLLIDGMDARTYASRGQSRTLVVAMKLAEAQYLSGQRQQRPILLLDDVLSELDSTRRVQILHRVSQYEQCFITTADAEAIEKRFLLKMTRFFLRSRRLETVERPSVADTG